MAEFVHEVTFVAGESLTLKLEDDHLFKAFHDWLSGERENIKGVTVTHEGRKLAINFAQVVTISLGHDQRKMMGFSKPS